jgi:hypothetical protein
MFSSIERKNGNCFIVGKCMKIFKMSAMEFINAHAFKVCNFFLSGFIEINRISIQNVIRKIVKINIELFITQEKGYKFVDLVIVGLK